MSPSEATKRPVASCDTMVVRGEATLAGSTLFAKNSDRPQGECQTLRLIERAEHPPGARLQCQYIEIPQVRSTARVLGSQPFWLWGFEHGLNEHGVAIGNETIFAREQPAATGLLGMDLVRLGLERSSSADEALAQLTSLIEAHGQGGSGYRDFELPYNNSFLVADSREAWILEAAGRHWAARRCRSIDAISNQVTIGADWDRVSSGAATQARAFGAAPGDPLDFEAAFRDFGARSLSESRLRRSRGRLAAGRGGLTPGQVAAVLRDHGPHGDPIPDGLGSSDEDFYTICMHQGPSCTTASMIAELAASPAGPRVAWASFGRACSSALFPVLLAGRLPEPFCRGSAEPSEALWWVFERLSLRAERDASVRARIRARFDDLEQELARSLREAPGFAGDAGQAEGLATRFMADVATRVDSAARALLAELETAASAVRA